MNDHEQKLKLINDTAKQVFYSKEHKHLRNEMTDTMAQLADTYARALDNILERYLVKWFNMQGKTREQMLDWLLRNKVMFGLVDYNREGIAGSSNLIYIAQDPETKQAYGFEVAVKGTMIGGQYKFAMQHGELKPVPEKYLTALAQAKSMQDTINPELN